MQWRVGVLGPVGVVVDGELVVPGSGVVRAALAALAVSAGAPVGVAQLARWLWNGADDVPNAARRTRLAVHRLRRWLSATVGGAVQVRTGVAGYELRIADGCTDLDAFRALVADAATRPPAARLAALRAALDLWRGPSFDTVPDGRVDPAVLTAVDNERRAARQSAARLALDTGDAELSIALAGAVCRADPFDEAAHATLMEALAVAGRQAEALRRFQELSAMLRETLGVDPGDLVRSAYLRILRQELPSAGSPPSAAPSTGPVPAGAVPAGAVPTGRGPSDVDTGPVRRCAPDTGRGLRRREYARGRAVRRPRSVGGGARRPAGTARPPPRPCRSRAPDPG